MLAENLSKASSAVTHDDIPIDIDRFWPYLEAVLIKLDDRF